jgi:hypothetical protein
MHAPTMYVFNIVTMPETKKELRELFASTGAPPGPRIIELQRSVLTLLGFEPDAAIAVLNTVGTEFANDKEVLTKMQYFGQCAQVAMK